MRLAAPVLANSVNAKSGIQQEKAWNGFYQLFL